ncbi:MAG: hypothetical protein UU76_C0027G0004 [Parcubacteria group bacterium GW2011_GWC1_41_7]|nr:MAG: hypothetical protein UU76_C0027G0004 [Parcubacteria group bacterium GW2011_GWC1_41_7]
MSVPSAGAGTITPESAGMVVSTVALLFTIITITHNTFLLIGLAKILNRPISYIQLYTKNREIKTKRVYLISRHFRAFPKDYLSSIKVSQLRFLDL